jgi:hypothetical protein
LYFGRFAVVHIGGPSSNQAASLESQQIQQIQLLFRRTLSPSTIPTGTVSTATAQSSGTHPSGDVYVGITSNGQSYECDFAIAGGTVSADGKTCTDPYPFAYYTQEHIINNVIYPGCVVVGSIVKNGNCNYTANFKMKYHQ